MRVLRVDRTIPADQARGEYIGVARFSAIGAASLRAHYHRVRAQVDGQVWKGGPPFGRAYLIHLFEGMLAAGEVFHMVTTDGQYMEVDAEEDFQLANQSWPERYTKP